MTDRRLPPRALHVTNGDITVRGLFDAGIEGPIEPWRDVLHEGPVPAVADDELRRIRARFLAAEDAGDIGTASELARRDDVLAAHRDGHYVLWFEADLYDQLQLVQILARLRELAVPPGRITLLCIGEHVGVARFGGLGELSSEQLAALPERVATTLGPEALAHAARAWDALRAPDPAGVEAIARVAPPSELRFVAEAFDRLGREYPSTRDGLALSERRILGAVAQGAGDGLRGLRPRRRPRAASVPRRHLGLRADDAARGRAGAAARDRSRRRPGRAADPAAADRLRPARAGGRG